MNPRCFITPALCAFVAHVPVSSQAEDLDTQKVVAIVNDEKITYAQVTAAIPAADQGYADARQTALEKLIDKVLLLQGARKIGGNVPELFMEDRIQSIVDNSFHGDKAVFEATLKDQGFTLEAFKKLQEEMILLQIMKKEIAGRETNPEARDQQIAVWLTAARAEAKISFP